MVDNFKMIESKKFMWDGETYENENLAQETKARYEENGFETQLFEEEGQYVVYTRRMVTEVVIEGEAPI